MISKPLIIVCGVLAVLLVAALIAVKALVGDVADLTAEKAAIQFKLDAANADIETSTKNHDRMMAEKDAALAAERRRSGAELVIQTSLTGTRKDISNATDGTKCTDSDPVAAALDGMRKLEKSGPFLRPVDRLPPAGRAGKPSKPGFAKGAAEGLRRQGSR